MFDSLPAVLGVVALLGSLAAAGLALYLAVAFLRPQRAARSAEPDVKPRPEPTNESTQDSAPSRDGGGPRRAQAVTAHSLFVIFPEPTSETQADVVAWLRKVEARYDSVFEVFNVAGEQPANPIKVANAFPPGTLPDLLVGQGSDGFQLRGLSLLVKPPLRRSRNQQMHVFVALARELEALGGEVLDADRQPATEQTYERILG
ncbi:cell division protein ZipA C-terminal FtsZ-binding domain-containing protein [Halomonas alkalicola]|uniref:cell division protein ZipA C-terminal FtsZ-binding domain-containing protein n=1 Tax=Halomonas alkalicola TaxID=1930622 RepID=UPI00265D8BC3|nr:cell division protein ZipA C-terminal FtsZ-binding domain-containing protein [Halomonas alkalicola]